MVKVSQYPRNADNTPMDLMVGVLTDETGNGGARLATPPVGPDNAPIDTVGLFLVGSDGNPVNFSDEQASRAEIAAITTPGIPGKTKRFLRESGREGIFVWDGSNLSTQVAADPRQAVFIAPAAAPTGASGAWRRVIARELNVKWFGAVGDNVTNDAAAFQAAFDFLRDTATGLVYSRGNIGLYVPIGTYFMGATTLVMEASFEFFGDGKGEAGATPTKLRWSNGCVGLIVQEGRGVGSTGAQANDTNKNAPASIVRGLCIQGGTGVTNDGNHGIQLRTRASIRDCWIDGWSGNGIHIVADSANPNPPAVPIGNVNNFELYKLYITGCAHGVYLQGGDVNAGSGFNIDVMYCRLGGITDNSFLGNTWTACHTSSNGGAPYSTSNPNARSVFIGCYSEGDQGPSSFSTATLVLGGLLASGVNAAAREIYPDANGINVRSDLLVGGTVIGSLRGSAVGVVGQGHYSYSGYYSGDVVELGSVVNFGGTIVPGIKVQNTGGGSKPFLLFANRLGFVSPANGFEVGGIDLTSGESRASFNRVSVGPKAGGAVATPNYIDMGGDYLAAPTNKLKVRIYDDGASEPFGYGVATGELYAWVPGTAKHGFLIGGTRRLEANSTGIDVTGVVKVGGTQVIGAQGAAVADAAALTSANGTNAAAAPTQAEFNALVAEFNKLRTDLTNTRNTLNTALARLRAATGHGLIA